jgi:hypothetical protein
LVGRRLNVPSARDCVEKTVAVLADAVDAFDIIAALAAGEKEGPKTMIVHKTTPMKRRRGPLFLSS